MAVITFDYLRVEVSDDLIEATLDPYIFLSVSSEYYLLYRRNTEDPYQLIPYWGIEMVEVSDIHDRCFFVVKKTAVQFVSPVMGRWEVPHHETESEEIVHLRPIVFFN